MMQKWRVIYLECLLLFPLLDFFFLSSFAQLTEAFSQINHHIQERRLEKLWRHTEISSADNWLASNSACARQKRNIAVFSFFPGFANTQQSATKKKKKQIIKQVSQDTQNDIEKSLAQFTRKSQLALNWKCIIGWQLIINTTTAYSIRLLLRWWWGCCCCCSKTNITTFCFKLGLLYFYCTDR